MKEDKEGNIARAFGEKFALPITIVMLFGAWKLYQAHTDLPTPAEVVANKADKASQQISENMSCRTVASIFGQVGRSGVPTRELGEMTVVIKQRMIELDQQGIAKGETPIFAGMSEEAQFKTITMAIFKCEDAPGSPLRWAIGETYAGMHAVQRAIGAAQ